MKHSLICAVFCSIALPSLARAEEVCGLLTGSGSVYTVADTSAPKQPNFLILDEEARLKLAAFNDTYVCISMPRIEYGGPAFNYVNAADFEIRRDDTIHIRDVRAQNCEVFIDKAMVVRERPNPGSTESLTTVELMIKANLNKLDGKIVKVAFFGNVEGTAALAGQNGTSPFPGRAQTLLGHDFVQAQDYFHAPLFPVAYSVTRCSGHGCTDLSDKGIFTGALYVQTETGSRYWINPANGNFSIDENLANTIATSFPSFGAQDIGAVPKTGDEQGGAARYLNPQRCR